jgi:hypothetical protein
MSATAVNQPPSKPMITGPTTGKVNIEYAYRVVSIDSDNDSIRYYVNWDDGTTDNSSLLASGTTYSISHRWTTNNVYTIELHVEDTGHALSDAAIMTIAINSTAVQGYGYRIDTNSDGIFDSFYSNSTGLKTTMHLQTNGTYLVDLNGDGVWDHLCDPVSNTISVYSPVLTSPPSKNSMTGMFLVIFAIVIIVIALTVWLYKSGRI